MLSRKPPSQELELGKSPAASSLQVIYPLLWVCFPSCTRTANPAAFPEGSAGAALSNLSPEIEALQWYTKGHLWGHGRQRPRRSNGEWEKWKGPLAPEMEGHLTKVCMRHPTPPPHGPNGQVLSVSEAEGLGLQGPMQEP